MKTIEERAKDYAPDALDADVILPAREGYIVKVQRDAYKQGATEQRKIDIDKAICWLMEFEDGYIQEWQIDDFRKAMEE